MLTSHRVGTTRRPAVISIRGPVEHAMVRFEEGRPYRHYAACGARVAPYGSWFDDAGPRACPGCKRALRAREEDGDGAA